MEVERTRVVSAEIQVEGEYLLTQRMPHAVLPLLWEFPGGRVRPGESDVAALRRVLAYRLGVDVDVDEKLLEVEHDYGQRLVTLVVYRCTIIGRSPRSLAVHDFAWVAPDGFADYPFPPADQSSIEQLLSED